jgi:hypothetical protein
MSKAALAAALAAVVLAGCGSSSSTGTGSTVSRSWHRADECLEKHPAFVGNVVGTDHGGSGKRGVLTVEGATGALANAFRYPSHRAAVAGERGIGPPGPGVTYFGQVALEINHGTSSGDAALIKSCL